MSFLKCRLPSRAEYLDQASASRPSMTRSETARSISSRSPIVAARESLCQNVAAGGANRRVARMFTSSRSHRRSSRRAAPSISRTVSSVPFARPLRCRFVPRFSVYVVSGRATRCARSVGTEREPSVESYETPSGDLPHQQRPENKEPQEQSTSWQWAKRGVLVLQAVAALVTIIVRLRDLWWYWLASQR